MADDKDAHLSGLYRQSSQEAPPADLDRAVMELARKSLRRHSLAPFGNHWMAAGALAGICAVSVLLVVLLREPAGLPGLTQPRQDTDTPVPELKAEKRMRSSGVDETAAGRQEYDAARPEAAGERFNFYSIMPEAERDLPAGDSALPSTASPVPAQATRAAGFFLEIGGFDNQAQAEAMQDKLEFMRLESSILPGDGAQSGYRIRIGPYSDPTELDRVQVLLRKRGIKTTRVR
jgi:cell division septation protein DedD